MRLLRWVGLPILALAMLLLPGQVRAAPQVQGGGGTPSNESCLACHSNPSLTVELASGETLGLYIGESTYAESVHGSKGYACVQCHPNISGYPHPALTATTRRDLSLQLYTTCRQCHSGNYERALDSVHGRQLEEGNPNAAVCTDCHGAHDVQSANEPRTRIPRTCAKCHNEIYQLYLTSVHGAALSVGNPDVPTCIDCHGVHNISEANSSLFRLRSPDICAKCHTDPALMNKYGVRTDVMNTYLADFHGTTVTLFEKTAPDQQTNKPVCVDCHSVHSIKLITDPNSTVIRRNLLSTCQKCHPDATENFPAAWLSHYSPSQDHNSLVYYVNLFYRYFIPGVLGGMALFVASDIGRRALLRRRKIHSPAGEAS
ncbi:MAG: cytochrome c3 family protein [Chloroflexi bacterium]|nr:cytochrome c3 family protein [Chloroflexota bacterium]